jgi:NADH dehydrogenase (ubiquinone) Fe-S protein 2
MNEFQYDLLNLGPQHPSTHGVLRIMLMLNGEMIIFIKVENGFLSRCTDKLIEYQSYNVCLPFFSRLDYVSTITQEGLFMNVLERFVHCYVGLYCSIIRVIFYELSRIQNHLLTITTHIIDIGALNPML